MGARGFRALKTRAEITASTQEYFQQSMSVKRAIHKRRSQLCRAEEARSRRCCLLGAKAHSEWTGAKWKTVLCSDKFEIALGKHELCIL